jgi:hypothetical protein
MSDACIGRPKRICPNGYKKKSINATAFKPQTNEESPITKKLRESEELRNKNT